MFFNTNFYWFFMALASQKKAKIDVFSLLFRKRRFCENRAPVEAKLLFLRLGAFGNPQKSKQNRVREKFAKKRAKIAVSFRFGGHFGQPWEAWNSKHWPRGLPKIHQKASKMPKKWILGRILDASFFEGGFGKGFGRILEGFLKNFELGDYIVDSYFSQCYYVRSGGENSD